MRREYTAEQRAEAIGMAMTVGPTKTAKTLGYPVKTVTNWTHSREATVLRIGTQEQLAQRLAEAVSVGLDEVLKGFRNPKARLGEKAAALRVVAEQHALLTGQATERTENMNLNVYGERSTVDARMYRDTAIWALSPEEADAMHDYVRNALNLPPAEFEAWVRTEGTSLIPDHAEDPLAEAEES